MITAVLQQTLKTALAAILPFKQKESNKHPLDNTVVLETVGERQLAVYVMNIFEGLSALFLIPASTTLQGKVIIPAASFKQVVDKLSPEKVELHRIGDVLHVRNAENKFKFNVITEECPPMVMSHVTHLELPIQKLVEVFEPHSKNASDNKVVIGCLDGKMVAMSRKAGLTVIAENLNMPNWAGFFNKEVLSKLKVWLGKVKQLDKKRYSIGVYVEERQHEYYLYLETSEMRFAINPQYMSMESLVKELSLSTPANIVATIPVSEHRNLAWALELTSKFSERVFICVENGVLRVIAGDCFILTTIELETLASDMFIMVDPTPYIAFLKHQLPMVVWTNPDGARTPYSCYFGASELFAYAPDMDKYAAIHKTENPQPEPIELTEEEQKIVDRAWTLFVRSVIPATPDWRNLPIETVQLALFGELPIY